MNYRSKKKRADSARDLVEQLVQHRRLLLAESTKNLAFRAVLNLNPASVRALSALGNHGQPRPAVVRVRGTDDEAVGLETIDELRHGGLHAGEPFGELPKRQRIAGLRQLMECRELRQRQADFRQLLFDARLQGAGGVEHCE